MNSILMWIFSKTSLGQAVDGNKRLIGFSVWLLGYVAQGLGMAGQYFPDTPVLGQASTGLSHFLEQIAPYLKNLGLGTMAVGVAHAAVKDKQ